MYCWSKDREKKFVFTADSLQRVYVGKMTGEKPLGGLHAQNE